MSDPDTTLRRNFTVAMVAHATLIGGLFVGEKWIPDFKTPLPTPVELVVPADILGELPQGPGHGRGAYTAPRETPPPTHGGGAAEATPPSPPSPPSHERTAPVPAPQPNDIGIPKPTRKPVKPVNVKPTKPEQNRNTGTQQVASAKPGLSADQARAGLLSALRSAGGGSPLGDNRPAGGGTGRGRLGSPDGAVDGIPGGIGQGSPNWRYYVHVHDRMYEAWDQSVALNDRKLLSIVMIKVGRDGSIFSVTLKRSSGNKRMDDSALAAAKKVQMLEPPPEALVKGSSAEIAVEFQLEG